MIYEKHERWGLGHWEWSEEKSLAGRIGLYNSKDRGSYLICYADRTWATVVFIPREKETKA